MKMLNFRKLRNTRRIHHRKPRELEVPEVIDVLDDLLRAVPRSDDRLFPLAAKPTSEAARNDSPNAPTSSH